MIPYNLIGRQSGGKAAYDFEAGEPAFVDGNFITIVMNEDTSFSQLLAAGGDECIKGSKGTARVYPAGYVLYLPSPAKTIQVDTGSVTAYEGF